MLFSGLIFGRKDKRRKKNIEVRRVIADPIRSKIHTDGELLRKENARGTATIEKGVNTRKAKRESRNWVSKKF